MCVFPILLDSGQLYAFDVIPTISNHIHIRQGASKVFTLCVHFSYSICVTLLYTIVLENIGHGRPAGNQIDDSHQLH